MHHILEFCLTKHWPNSSIKYSPGIHGFVPTGYGSTDDAVAGDLVVLSSIRAPSKWQIGWLKKIDKSESGWPRYLIESLEDEELCWWENVGVAYFERSKVSPTWRWDDRQWAFNDRWLRQCYKVRDAYMKLPIYADFGDGYSVTLGTRMRMSLSDLRPQRTFSDWRKVTKAMMLECYDECVAEHDAESERIKREREEREAAESPG
jgi:hypothetical protein